MRESWFRRLNARRWRKLHRRYGSKSMLGRRLFAENLAVAQYHLKSHALPPGCFVECGTWAGGLSFSMMTLLDGIAEWHFFDSFEGLPVPGALDGAEAKQDSAIWHNNNSADYDAFMKSLSEIDARGARVTVHRGWFESTTPHFESGYPISILRLDGDWYESTMTCLEAFFDRVSPGGLIIIDDYDDWVGCRRALHDFLSRREASERIQRSSKGVVYLTKD